MGTPVRVRKHLDKGWSLDMPVVIILVRLIEIGSLPPVERIISRTRILNYSKRE